MIVCLFSIIGRFPRDSIYQLHTNTHHHSKISIIHIETYILLPRSNYDVPPPPPNNVSQQQQGQNVSNGHSSGGNVYIVLWHFGHFHDFVLGESIFSVSQCSQCHIPDAP
mmetsp:Transcript_7773/g.11325  ORF Transcript_7773/g.11325 Transcript_7773/m.11325 type:complete len:110 (+) Transcript_7773:121-450(+)